MLLKYFLFLPATLAVGWFGTRSAHHIRRAKGTRRDVLLMLGVCWSPLATWLVALLLFLSGRNP